MEKPINDEKQFSMGFALFDQNRSRLGLMKAPVGAEVFEVFFCKIRDESYWRKFG